ncbi:MAG: hypothetical protein K1X64_09955 [Myxococcaceae bacterium]|nr:hypothetical protein [Myxococcaceae bacterium]
MTFQVRQSALFWGVWALVLSGCGSPTPLPTAKIPTTYRIISGVSMGGIGANALGFRNLERFDGIGAMGGPLEGAFFMHMLDKFLVGGFCPLADIERVLAENPQALNDPVVMNACAQHGQRVSFQLAEDFNNWVFTTSGGSFDRDNYIRLLNDLTLAFGNFLTENPQSPFAPAGVDRERARFPPADYCSHPVRLKGVYNAEYNPQGKYDVITFCDGQPVIYYCADNKERVDFCSVAKNKVTPLPLAQEQAFAQAFCQGKGVVKRASREDEPLLLLSSAGKVDPCRETFNPVATGLAIDFNGNGRRDYGEPLLNNGQERFDDVGVDGCADANEDGHGGCLTTARATVEDFNHDNFDMETNPFGTENDWKREVGEPFRDDGLDGVPGTLDIGEGNGTYDLSSGRQAFFAYDAREQMRQNPEALKRVDIFTDGGLRDLFNFGLQARMVFKAAEVAGGKTTGSYRDFTEIPGMADRRTGVFSPWNKRWKNVPRDLNIIFGKAEPTDEERIEGEGDHVGTATQAVNRFYAMFNWAAMTWPHLERPPTPYGGSSASERQKTTWFDSKILGGKREYSIALPPGYDEPENKDKRYPVIFIGHGYGSDSQSMMFSSLITDAYVQDVDVQFRPMILVFPSGRCCFTNAATGGVDCRERDDNGVDWDDQPGWKRECEKGSFYVNRRGYKQGDERRYGDSFEELMEHIDATYRTVRPAEVEAR